MIDSVLPFLFAMFCLGYGTAMVPKSSPLRPILFVIIVPCCLISLRSSFARRIPGAVLHDFMSGYMFHASNFLLVSKVEPPPHVTSLKQRALFGLNQVIDGRWGIDPNAIPLFDEKRRHYVPSRGKLFLQRLRDFLLCGALAYYLENLWLFPAEDYVSPGGFLRRIHEVSRHELLVRIYFAFIGTAIPYLGLRAAHCLTTCVALALGDAPERWPPLFGKISDAYTIRNVWALFWHRAMRKALTSHAVLLVNSVLRLPRKSKAARYLITLVTFALLGFMHILTCPGIELCVTPAQLADNIGTVGAIMAEDGVMALYRKTKGSAYKERAIEDARANGHAAASSSVALAADSKQFEMRNRTSNGNINGTMEPKTPRTPRQFQNPGGKPWWVFRLLGFVWVSVFWTWSTSNLMYAIYSC